MTRAETLATAATATLLPASGPIIVQLLGYDVPLLSALVGVAGVAMALELAPPPPRRLNRRQKWALRGISILLVLCLVIYDQKSPFITLGWAIGLGFSAYTVIELLGALIPERLKRLFEAAFGASPESPEDQNDEL